MDNQPKDLGNSNNSKMNADEDSEKEIELKCEKLINLLAELIISKLISDYKLIR
jgi:hypothetical protein